jgi:anti-anti-sigma factor
MTTHHRIHPQPPVQDLFHLDVCREDPDEALIYVCGDLDIATTPVLAACLSNLLDGDTACRALVVDLSGGSFVDVGGANLLLDAHWRATDRRAALCLRGCSAQLVRLLQLTHILDVVDVVPVQRTCSTAVGALGHRPIWICRRGMGSRPSGRTPRRPPAVRVRVGRVGRSVEVPGADMGRSPAPRSAGLRRTR